MSLNTYFDVHRELAIIRSKNEPSHGSTALEYLEEVQRDFQNQARALISAINLDIGYVAEIDQDTACKMDDASWDVAANELAIHLGQKEGIPWNYFASALKRFENWYLKRVLATH